MNKSIDSFYRNKLVSSGYDAKCKICKNTGRYCVKKESVKRSKPKDTTLMMLQVTKEDWIETYKFLEKIGYDLNEDLHLQFCQKYNLKPRKRMKEKTIQYSPKDLGLI